MTGTREIAMPITVTMDESPKGNADIPLGSRYTQWFGPYRLRDFWGCVEDDVWDAKAEGYMGA